ncbi:MAG TPA: amidohydrolase family protein [Vicinamibacteria bacterium]|nr:amidohydrolase family protein [Vicinamibacteria bacterium]
MAETLVLRADWVLPIVAPPIRDGAVAVAAGRIQWVGEAASPLRPKGQERDLGSGVLLPGPVNAHAHLELSALAGRVPAGVGFTRWVEALVAARDRLTPGEARAGIAAALAALEEAGTAAVADVSNALDHLDLLEGAPFESVVFFEQIGWDPARAEEVLERADRRLRELPAGRTAVHLAAHAPHSVSAALMRGLVARGGPRALHLAESADEVRFLRDGRGPWRAFLEGRVGEVPFVPPAKSPVAYVAELGALKAGLVAAHCAEVEAADVRRLAAARVSVVACPRSNRTIGEGVPPVPDLLAAGVNVALGTDSLASTPSLEVLDDAVALAREFPELAPATIVRMATTGGARALGLSDLGGLAPGRRAALAFAAASGPLNEPHRFLLSGAARLRRAV